MYTYVGGWASLDKMDNLKQAREKLSLLKQFKEDDKCCTLIELESEAPSLSVLAQSAHLNPKTAKSPIREGLISMSY